MIKVKLFAISKENNEYLEFLKSEGDGEHEEDSEMLAKYMNHWFRQNQNKEIIKISDPVWAENHLFVFVWYSATGVSRETLAEPAVRPKRNQKRS